MLGLRNAPFLEASRRNSKEDGAKSQEEYKGTQDAKSVFLVGIFGSWWPVCGEAVRGTTRSSELAVGGESGRGTRDTDGRRRFASSVAQACTSMWRVPERARRPHGRQSSAAAVLAAVGDRRRASPTIAPRGCR